MKHLKTYQIFENIEKFGENADVKVYIEDIFLELKDDGFDVKVEGKWHMYPPQIIGYEVRIKKEFPVKTFLIKDVYEDILTLKSYLEEVGFFISEVNGNISLDREKYANYYIRPSSISLPSDLEELKLFDKTLMSLTFKIRKEE